MPENKNLVVGHMTGKIYKQKDSSGDIEEIPGTWEVAVYFNPNAVPRKAIAYFIGYANKVEE